MPERSPKSERAGSITERQNLQVTCWRQGLEQRRQNCCNSKCDSACVLVRDLIAEWEAADETQLRILLE